GRREPRRARGGALRRQHPPRHASGQAAGGGGPQGRLRAQPQDRAAARHQGPPGPDRERGRGVPVAQAAAQRAMPVAAPARAYRRLIWKYAFVVVTLVAAAVVAIRLTELYFSYQDSKRTITRAERAKASSAALSIGQFVQETLGELEGVATPEPSSARFRDFEHLFVRDARIASLTYLDKRGK